MYYENYYYGMNIIWWAIWIILLFWIFAMPFEIPGQRHKKDSAFDLLQKRYANGDITFTEYYNSKKNLEINFNES